MLYDFITEDDTDDEAELEVTVELTFTVNDGSEEWHYET